MLNDEMKLLKRTRGKLMTKNRVLQSQQVKIAAQIKQLIAKAEVRVPFSIYRESGLKKNELTFFEPELSSSLRTLSPDEAKPVKMALRPSSSLSFTLKKS